MFFHAVFYYSAIQIRGYLIVKDEDPKSIGHSMTLPKDISDREAIKAELQKLSSMVCSRARNYGFVGIKFVCTPCNIIMYTLFHFHSSLLNNISLCMETLIIFDSEEIPVRYRYRCSFFHYIQTISSFFTCQYGLLRGFL